jgi:hypothetical protein
MSTYFGTMRSQLSNSLIFHIIYIAITHYHSFLTFLSIYAAINLIIRDIIMEAVEPILVGVQATAQSVAQRADAFLQINLANTVRSSNKACRNEWRNFRLWVDAQRNSGIIPPGDTHLKQENVDVRTSQR